MTAQELYGHLCQFAADNGWQRERRGSGWWFYPDGGGPEGGMTIGELVEHELDRAGIDTRKPPAVVIHVDPPGGATGEAQL